MLRIVSEASAWHGFCATYGVADPYYSWPYLELWARDEGGQPWGLVWEGPGGAVIYPVVRVPLDALPGGQGRCDIRTPYDFGGPLCVGADPEEALRAFEHAAGPVFERWGVVTEFARLHPFVVRAGHAASTLHAENLIVDLTQDHGAIQAGFGSTCRYNIRMAARRGVTARVEWRPSARDSTAFASLYAETMARLEAPGSYCFSAETLAGLLVIEGVGLIVAEHDGVIVAALCMIRSSGALFYFLASSSLSARRLCANNLLLDAAVREGQRLGLRHLHLGGGAPSLRKFKGHFATGTVPYHLVKRVVDPAAYEGLCRGVGVEPDRGFPAYREWLRARVTR